MGGALRAPPCRLQVGDPGANCKAAALGTRWDSQVVFGWRRPYGRLPIRYCAEFKLWDYGLEWCFWEALCERLHADCKSAIPALPCNSCFMAINNCPLSIPLDCPPTTSRRSRPCLAIAALWQLTIVHYQFPLATRRLQGGAPGCYSLLLALLLYSLSSRLLPFSLGCQSTANRCSRNSGSDANSAVEEPPAEAEEQDGKDTH